MTSFQLRAGDETWWNFALHTQQFLDPTSDPSCNNSWQYTPVILGGHTVGTGDWKFKLTLSYLVSWKPVWAT